MLKQNPHFNAINAAFPHIGTKLQAFWGHPEFVRYMHGLLHDSRDGQRRGFPFDVLMALNALSDLHEVSHPHLAPQEDMWAVAKKR